MMPRICSSTEALTYTSECCGDGYYDQYEECDEGINDANNHLYCSIDCKITDEGAFYY